MYSENKIGNNKLIFTNKTESDIILKKEFKEILGENFINTLTDKKKDGYDNRMINTAFLKKKTTDFTQNFYVCGPPPFEVSISKALASLDTKTNSVVFEK